MKRIAPGFYSDGNFRVVKVEMPSYHREGGVRIDWQLREIDAEGDETWLQSFCTKTDAVEAMEMTKQER